MVLEILLSPKSYYICSNSSFGSLLLKQREEATCHYSPPGSQNLADLELSGGSRCQEGMMMTFLSLFFEKRNNYFPEFLHSN